MMRYIGKCDACKQVSARDYTETRTEKVRQQIAPGYVLERDVTYYVRRTASGCDVRASKDHQCERCGEFRWEGRRVDGVLSSRKCDARCTNAKGFRCECSCAGRNHGQGFLVCEPVAA